MARDDFTPRTRDRLARRAGHKCSWCQITTVSRSSDADDAVSSIGVAAHIAAASKNGPRYDSAMTPAQRRDITNGIWLCQNHARLIDTDSSTYTVEFLRDMREKHEAEVQTNLGRGGPMATTPAPTAPDTSKYLEHLVRTCGWIDIRGIQLGSEKAHRFPIDELYIPLTTHMSVEADSDDARPKEQTSVPLQNALSHRRLVIIGDPGAGKSTFVMRIAHSLASARLDGEGATSELLPELAPPPVPILVRLGKLATYLKERKAEPAPSSLFRFLGSLSEEHKWRLSAPDFEFLVENESCILLLDGLDEAPDRASRAVVRELIESLGDAFDHARVVVTSRPAAYKGDALLSAVHRVQIDELDEGAVQAFLEKWTRAIAGDSEEEVAGPLRSELLRALRTRPEIRRMATNPVMLTCLAVVQWNERRLPEQRADLYESIVRWLSRAREQKPGRLPGEQVLPPLEDVALLMQQHPDGRQVQLDRGQAADEIACQFESHRDAVEFLESEELDSGIVVSRGNEIRFWHLSFQEFLAARGISGRLESEQFEILLVPERLCSPEWRETVLLFVGVLWSQGRRKVDAFLKQVLEHFGPTQTLTRRAEGVALIGGVLRDLAPVNYIFRNPRWTALQDEVMRIFDKDPASQIPIETRIDAAEALGRIDDPRLTEDNWMRMPGGKVLLGMQSDPKLPGYDADTQEAATPTRNVGLASFDIARFPVSVAEFRGFVEEGYADERWWHAGGFGQFTEPREWITQSEHGNRPVTGVSWFESVAYASWRCSRESRDIRLPTEAQWQYAARGLDSRRYPWRDADPTPDHLNYDYNVGRPTPIGVYPRGSTPEGVRDMGGNVWEWTSDAWTNDYSDVDFAEKDGAHGGSGDRVIRGGGFRSDARGCRSAFRSHRRPGYRDDDLGFRLSRRTT